MAKPARDTTPLHTLENVRTVLVNSAHPGNIGGAARALKNMGLKQLYLVAPREFPAANAIWRAAGAAEMLDSAVVVDTLEEAVADCGLVVATSARERRIPWPLLTPRQCGARAIAEAASHPVAIVFGREDRGLTNEELQACNFHVHIPANPHYSSLNLATAVQVLAYEIRIAALEAEKGEPLRYGDWDCPPAKASDMALYFEHLQQSLGELGFIDPDNPRQTMTRLRRLFSRVRPDDMELGILRGMLTAIQNHIHRSGGKGRPD
ncbi:tRNA (cytosine(32)/uridine(32)-2'-O)-methyltransferase TrmJ [Microbulbifer sp. 2205BS26-8]|uniref:tRNA (cytosine(32)/uridine(32)-2'-O)-methyltransferase TrmJ n=1 Tax=Microbulbifer sp. 2205BS26-8 TaxID=3064386 RepID=UPI00273FFF63|nr:tRNA (cytosine(32)/uridine(32)-2'-O)-methyltransferase TrmJ [Microbulbifer sp. 2205BS26-8]MDP5210083.1 tRNA (cytosine(32)/uridine(32)-2'-O)-methyltransferase TrmJ [Microbulbifer sp. 2205BS26-8]